MTIQGPRVSKPDVTLESDLERTLSVEGMEQELKEVARAGISSLIVNL